MKLKPAVNKVILRIIPYLFLCYIFNYLDRFNVAFASLQMNQDLNFSDSVYSLGAGIFFLGYFALEIPSNLVLEWLGARRWISRIMVSWGIISTLMLFVKTATGFYFLRFLLGAAEAGFFPGIIYYLSQWIPARQRSRVFALFLTSTALAGAFGGGLSAFFLNMDGMGGLRGWQWLFLAEGLPSFLLGIVTFFYLTDRIEEAHWLAPSEKKWLKMEIRRGEKGGHLLTLRGALWNRRVLHLSLLYFFIIIAFYGVSFWLPQIVKHLSRLDNVETSLVSSVPWIFAALGMVWVAHHSDQAGERRFHIAFSALAACLALLVWAYSQSRHPYLAFAASCATATGVWSTLGPFWKLPTIFLSKRAAAGGIALINSVGNLGGFVGARVIGYFKQTTNSFEGGMLVLSLSLMLAFILALVFKDNPNQDKLA